MAKKRIVVTDSDGMYKSSEGLDARLAALDVATDAEVPRTAFECADRSAEIFALDQLIEEQHEKLKTLRKQREDLVRSLLDAHASSVESSGPSSRAFVRLVTEMRDAQKAYFAGRDGNALRRSMSLETEVDRALSLRDGVEHTLFEEGI
jgi:hypothetical protein